jgi:hypothetical protein
MRPGDRRHDIPERLVLWIATLLDKLDGVHEVFAFVAWPGFEKELQVLDCELLQFFDFVEVCDCADVYCEGHFVVVGSERVVVVGVVHIVEKCLECIDDVGKWKNVDVFGSLLKESWLVQSSI